MTTTTTPPSTEKFEEIATRILEKCTCQTWTFQPGELNEEELLALRMLEDGDQVIVTKTDRGQIRVERI